MKKQILKSVFALLAILMIGIGAFSCKKDTIENKDDNNNNNNTGELYFNVKIDGQDYPSDIGNGKTIHFSHSGTLLTIKDKEGNEPGFFINIFNYSGAKTYELSESTSTTEASNGSYSELVSPTKWNFWSSTATTPGTITISNDKNNVIEGAFSFEGYNDDTQTTKVFTEGKFKLKVQE